MSGKYTEQAVQNLRLEQRQLDADGVEVGVSREALTEVLREYDWLVAMLHAACAHPAYVYETTTGPRKAFDENPPESDGWERNWERGTKGWAREEYHEEAYWRRLRGDDLAAINREGGQ